MPQAKQAPLATSPEEWYGGYWNLSGQSEFASAMATFILPADFHWWEFYTGQMDSCSSDNCTYSGSISGYDCLKRHAHGDGELPQSLLEYHERLV